MSSGARFPGVPVRVLRPNPPMSGITAAMIRKFPATPVRGITSRGASWVRPSAWSRNDSSRSLTASFIERISARMSASRPG